MSETLRAPQKIQTHEQSEKYFSFQIKRWTNFDPIDKTIWMLSKPARLAAFCAFACLALPLAMLAAPTITYVQGNYSDPQSSLSSVAVRFNGIQTSGDLNVVVVGWNDSTVTVSSVTDSSGNLYQRAVGPTVVSGFLSQSIYYGENILSAAAGTNTVTVSFSGAAAFPTFAFWSTEDANIGGRRSCRKCHRNDIHSGSRRRDVLGVIDGLRRDFLLDCRTHCACIGVMA